MAIKRVQRNKLYLVNVLKTPQVFLANFLWKPAQIYVQHCHFGHIEVDAIRNIVKKRLVDELNIVGAHTVESICENCIFGKIYNLLYNEEIIYKIKVLEYIHVDLWNLSPVISAGGSCYFILLMDRALSFQVVEFLAEKTAENMFKVLKAFIIESERQIGQKLIQVRLNYE